jgi:DnaJ family protein C protein 17
MAADEDPYATLGLEFRVGLTDAEIKKAYRKKALVVHPDKRKEREREVAQREFDVLQKAYDVLLDPLARKALEDLANARAASRARNESQDLKRRKLREDLERRERSFENGKTEERDAKARLQQELLRLRRDFATRKRGYDVEAGTGNTTATGEAHGNGNSRRTPHNHHWETKETVHGKESTNDTQSVEETQMHLYRTVKVTWRGEISAYPVRKLREVFRKHGDVEDVVVRDSGKKKKSALVVFRNVNGATAAARAVNGDAGNPLVTVRAATPPSGWSESADARTSTADFSQGNTDTRAEKEDGVRRDRSVPTTSATATETVPIAAGSQGNTANRDYESVVLDRMRRAQEKARIIAQMEAEDLEEEK